VQSSVIAEGCKSFRNLDSRAAEGTTELKMLFNKLALTARWQLR
jgi:hypothetical protein